ncbi:uncharacterized protein TRIVIDRAFT_154543 [Trichoderma virens Gv29-8]|uniref:DUF7580 domain-containing protein n=1 Tax=Hypocrea virens (strain Gv29-8 / FGSC 10586) TaxID=413071 RepID=G9MYJ5_HYPVG|nr:uncharacterized protein TRIVIDRAFT_154543 [Trichoderma virens Gv29-8]EHK20615.1 hypothetical protein TRIVIDRAFT_154543 [Trichoderma virens Gv29-8]
MAEVIGLALSVLPIVIWALEKYSEPFDAYSDYHNAISTLQANLQIQRMHLEATFQSIGLRHPTPRELHECLRQKFPQNHREIVFLVRQMDDMMMKLMENLQVDMSRKPLWTHESPERVSWEWRRVKRSFRAKKCDKIIHDLRNWNDDLRHLVESAQTLPSDESYAMRRVRRLYNRSNCESVRRTLQSLHRALQAGLDSDDAECHQVCIELNSFHAGGFPLLTFRIGILHESGGTQTAPWKVFYAACEAGKKSPRPESPPMSPYSVRSRPSTLRSRRSVEDTSITPSIAEIISPSPPPISNLCDDFDSTPRGDVFGSLKDPSPSSSYETIFSLSHVSRNHDRIIRDISLEKIIATESQRVAPAIQPLSAKRRYGIAASLAWAVLYLSDSPWLSHGLDRRKVMLFLQRKKANGYISLSEKVYLSCLIPKNSSFPSPVSSSTSLRQTTPKNLIFELGILLIELAVNQSFSKESLSAIVQHDYRPLKQYLDRVEQEAGIYYFNAAQRCVYSVFLADQEQMDFDLDKFQHEFYSTVVAPLQATYEAR